MTACFALVVLLLALVCSAGEQAPELTDSGVERDQAEAIRLFRAAAAQGDNESAYKLVVLCKSQPRCIAGRTAEEVSGWLRAAGARGVAEAAFQAGLLEFRGGRSSDALEQFLVAGKLDHPGAMYNAAHILSKRLTGRTGKGLADVLGWFAQALHAARAQDQPKVEADALRALWVWLQETNLRALSHIFAAADKADGVLSGAFHMGVQDAAISTADAAESTGSETEAACVRSWEQGIALWAKFQQRFALWPSTMNEEALQPLRQAVEAFATLLQVGSKAGHGPGEFRRNLILTKLAQGSKFLAQDAVGMQKAMEWHATLAKTPLCSGLFAQVESSPSCFNDQLVAAITMSRRLNDTDTTEALIAVGRAHPFAATHWVSSVQTPRIFHPNLTANPWWDSAKFNVVASLEAAWASGGIAADVERLGIAAVSARKGQFERMMLNGEQVKSAHATDDRGAGSWSEFKLFDGEVWNEERCKLASVSCALLRAAPEVSGIVVTSDGKLVRQQGEVTIYRLLPGAQILPHTGVTNRGLVMHFPLVGIEGVRFRVAHEWRSYEEGRAMVFDDSFEHEVVHQGKHDRYVLFAVIHHPELGTPTLKGNPLDASSKPPNDSEL